MELLMSFSIQRETSDGTLSTLDLTVEYIDRTDVRAYVNDIEIDLTGGSTPYTWEWITDSQIKITPNVPNGLVAMLKRSTPMDAMYHIYDAGAVFKDETVDENFKQVLFLSQEAKEGSGVSDIYSNVNMHGYVIGNHGAAALDGDLVTFGQYRNDSLGSGFNRVAAEAARDVAVAAKDTAVTSATAAGNSAGAASTSATNAANSASASDAARTLAQDAATNAVAAYDSFDDRYLGPKNSDPTLDNDGNTLLEGALYWNTVAKEMRVYSGTVWAVAYLPVGAYVTEAELAVELANKVSTTDLANATDPAKGAALVGYRDKTVADALDLSFAGTAYVGDYGVLGSASGAMVDDTAAFLAACADCKAKGLRLNIGTLKIYLPTLSAPIDLDGFLIEGTGLNLYAPMDDWSVPRGINNESVYLIPDALQQDCAVIIHTGFDGPLFTGKAFNAKNIGILGKFSLTNNKGFEQSTPTAYPGWSQALKHTDKVVIGYTGSDGIHIKGGLELLRVGRIVTKFCGNHGLYVTTTDGVESPIEYLTFEAGAYTSSRKENIRLSGVRKHVDFGGIVLNDPGMIRLRPGGAVPGTTAPTSEANLTAGLLLNLTGAATVFGVRVNGTIAEYCNLLVKTTGNYINGLSVTNTTQYPLYESGWVWRTGVFTNTNSRDASLLWNYGNISQPVFSFSNHGSDTRVLVDNLTLVYGISPSVVMRFLTPDQRTGTIGDGTAASFTTTIMQALEKPAANAAGLLELFSVVANFQGTGANGAGAYLLLVTRGAGGNYVGITFAGSSTTGFSSAPTVDATTGVITVHLQQYYRARITRLDRGVLTTAIVTAP